MSGLTRTAASGFAPSGWLVLVKPRIASLVVLAALVGALLASGPGGNLGYALEAALWIGCVAASSCVFNQVMERDVDRLMVRTAARPLVTGAIRTRDAILFGAALGAAGTLGLALRFNEITALLALATLATYALVYTPLKRVSTLNTVVGALPGAMPPLLGYAAITGGVDGWGLYLFASLFAWQFPHFMAIAYLYREDYARAGLRMLPAVEGGVGMAGRQAVAYALVLLPVSLLPVVRGEAGLVYAVSALLLGLTYLGFSIVFAAREGRASARALLITSLVYLPVLYATILVDPVVHFIRSN
jgi:protoheme IX farnesyltransferase